MCSARDRCSGSPQSTRPAHSTPRYASHQASRPALHAHSRVRRNFHPRGVCRKAEPDRSRLHEIRIIPQSYGDEAFALKSGLCSNVIAAKTKDPLKRGGMHGTRWSHDIGARICVSTRGVGVSVCEGPTTQQAHLIISHVVLLCNALQNCLTTQFLQHSVIHAQS